MGHEGFLRFVSFTSEFTLQLLKNSFVQFKYRHAIVVNNESLTRLYYNFAMYLFTVLQMLCCSGLCILRPIAHPENVVVSSDGGLKMNGYLTSCIYLQIILCLNKSMTCDLSILFSVRGFNTASIRTTKSYTQSQKHLITRHYRGLWSTARRTYSLHLC